MNAQEIRDKANALGDVVKGLVERFEDETDTTVTDLAMVRVEYPLRDELVCIQVGVKVL